MFIVWGTSTYRSWFFSPKTVNIAEILDESDEIDALLDAQFTAATTRLPAFLTRIDQKEILKFYGLYKQAVEGPADPKKGPYWYDTVARMKFNSWLSNGTMNRSTAMQNYISMMAELDEDWDPNSATPQKTGGFEKMPSTLGIIEPEMFDECVIEKPTRLETEIEKSWFAAMRKEDVPAMKVILKENPEILEAKDENLSMTALLWATDLGYEGVVKFLIDAGADVNATDGCLQNALHFAAQCHRPQLAELLIQAGGDKTALDADGMTPSEVCDDMEMKKILALD